MNMIYHFKLIAMEPYIYIIVVIAALYIVICLLQKSIDNSTDQPFICPDCGKLQPHHYLHKKTGTCFLCNFKNNQNDSKPNN